MGMSSLAVWVGSLLLIHAICTSIQHSTATGSPDAHPIVVVEAFIGFILATFGYMHKAGRRFTSIHKKTHMQEKKLEHYYYAQDFMTFNHRGQVANKQQ